jgi:tyrosinase
MKLSSIVSAFALASTAAALPSLTPRADSADQEEVAKLTESIRADILEELDEREAKLAKRGETATCNARNVVFRRE